MRRLAIPSDIERVYAIYMDPQVVPFLGHDPLPRDAFARVFDPLFESGGFYVYEVAGQVQGFYQLRRHVGRAAHVAYLGTLAVAPAMHGRGVAGAMLRDAIERLRRASIRRVELTVEADNPRAIAFYQRLGFEYEGRQRAAYKRAADDGYVDELMYALLLQAS